MGDSSSDEEWTYKKACCDDCTKTSPSFILGNRPVHCFKSSESSSDEEFVYQKAAKRPTLNEPRSSSDTNVHFLDALPRFDFSSENSTDSDSDNSSDQEAFGIKDYFKQLREAAPPRAHRNTLNRERTSQTEVLSIDDISDRVSVSTQESSSLRSKPKVHVGKTIRKRKQTSQKEVPVLKAAKVLELGECASALGFQCKCPQQCSGNFTTVAIQEFRKKYWELSAKVCNASSLNTQPLVQLHCLIIFRLMSS